jgi:hypothetical protein
MGIIIGIEIARGAGKFVWAAGEIGFHKLQVLMLTVLLTGKYVK